MRVFFAKSLDRPLDLFGLKGTWIIIFLCLAGVSLLLAIIVGVMLNSTSYGIACALFLIIISFILCLFYQEKYSYRQVKKLKSTISYPLIIRRRETVSRAMIIHDELKH